METPFSIEAGLARAMARFPQDAGRVVRELVREEMAASLNIVSLPTYLPAVLTYAMDRHVRTSAAQSSPYFT
jgi:hypothetical protein